MTPFIKDADQGFNSCVAAALRARRAQVQMTFSEVAERSEIPEVTLIRIFTEKRVANFPQVAADAEAMNTTVQEIVEESERESVRRHGNPYGYSEVATVTDLSERFSRLDQEQAAALDPGYSPEMEQDPETP